MPVSGPTTRVSAPDGTSAVIHHLGATVISFKDPSGKEILYVSSKAAYGEGAAIRGGIPVCWPQFGPSGPWPKQHGFARNVLWTVEEAASSASSVKLTLDRAPVSPKDPAGVLPPPEFPHPFRLELTVAVSDGGVLAQELRVINPAPAPPPAEAGSGRPTPSPAASDLRFTTALHTYLRTTSIRETRVLGLRGCTYADNLSAGSEAVDDEPAVAFAGETDRLYAGTPDELRVEVDDLSGRPRTLVTLAKDGFPDAVVWNPWEGKAAGMADLDGWTGFVCVEVASAARGERVSVPPGGEWVGKQVLRASL